MARQEVDREDLIREATALVERIELQPPASAGWGPLVAGFRRTGALSLFFDADPVLQFNPQGQLRRAYFEGRLWKAEAGRLIAMSRQRDAGSVTLLRQELTADQQSGWLERMRGRLEELLAWIDSGQLTVLRQVPSHVDLLARVREAVARVNAPLTVADRPHADG